MHEIFRTQRPLIIDMVSSVESNESNVHGIFTFAVNSTSYLSSPLLDLVRLLSSFTGVTFLHLEDEAFGFVEERCRSVGIICHHERFFAFIKTDPWSLECLQNSAKQAFR